MGQTETDIQNALLLHAQRLRDATPEQCAVLLPFARHVFEQDAARGDALDAKANWLLVAGFTAFSAVMYLVADKGVGLVLAVGAAAWFLLAAFVAVLVAIVAALVAKRASRRFATPTPTSVLVEETLGPNYGPDVIARVTVLHYFDLFERNRRVTDDRGRIVMLSLWALVAGVALAAIPGLMWAIAGLTHP